MRVARFLLVLVVGCGGGTGDDLDDETADCSQPLPATSGDGEPWPTYSVANAELADCEQLDLYWFRRRGSCSDGRLFLEKGSGFIGDTYYFAGEATVGVSTWSDVVGSCDANRLGDATCEEVSSQEITCYR